MYLMHSDTLVYNCQEGLPGLDCRGGSLVGEHELDHNPERSLHHEVERQRQQIGHEVVTARHVQLCRQHIVQCSYGYYSLLTYKQAD
jgi:hypothetical protein